MPVVASSVSLVLTKTPQILYTAAAGDLPGVFAGKVDMNQLVDNLDQVTIKMETKYSAGDSFNNSHERSALKTQKTFRITPVREDFGYQISAELHDDSPSATGEVKYVITREDIT